MVLDPGTTYVQDLHPSVAELLGAHVGTLMRRPVAYLRYLLNVIRLRSEMGRGPGRVRWTFIPLLAQSVTRRESVALHAHFGWSGAAAGRLLSLLTGLPWSVTLHANDIFSDRRNLEFKLRRADRLITVCEYNLRWLREHLGLTRDVGIVVCGVELPDASETSIEGADVVAVGRLVPKKGFDTLIHAAALVRAVLPDFTVDIIGDGECHDDLKRLVDELNLTDCVRLLGSRPHAETLGRIAGAKIFCLPCRVADDGDRDSMPVVIKEAMVRGTPIVSTNAVAVPEMLEQGCGLMSAPNDHRSLAESIMSLLTDPALRDRIVEAAHARAVANFTLSGEVEKLRRQLVPAMSAPDRDGTPASPAP